MFMHGGTKSLVRAVSNVIHYKMSTYCLFFIVSMHIFNLKPLCYVPSSPDKKLLGNLPLCFPDVPWTVNLLCLNRWNAKQRMRGCVLFKLLYLCSSVLFCFVFLSLLKLCTPAQIIKMNNTENYAAQGQSKQTQMFLNNVDREGEPALISTSGENKKNCCVLLELMLH